MARPRSPQFPIAAVLEELGADAVPRVRGGGHRKMRCPFHPDTSPSASVSEYGFTCFGCGRTGDAIKLMREEEQLSYADAVERCAGITGAEGGGVQRERGWGTSLLD